jgi:hypothetical protein
MKRPQPFDAPTELWLARIRADELRESWRSVNGSAISGASEHRNQATIQRRFRVRTDAGRALVWLGRLISGDAAVRVEQPARRAQPGC